MIEKEIAEIRRRFRPDKSNISHVRGCYVNDAGEIVCLFNQSLTFMPQEEAEGMLAILRRTLSGALDKNLIDIAFSTQQVVDSGEHRLLMDLKNSGLKDETAVQSFFQKVIDTHSLEGNYLILLAHDVYDVPYRATDGGRLEDASSEVFSYILCSICPVKMTKPALSYSIHQNEFHNCRPEWMVAAPELGFLFPAFDDRRANIYHSLYYSRDTGESHREFAEAVFARELPMAAAVQKETFESMLEDTLSEDCQYQVVQAIHDQMREMIVEHQKNKEEPPPSVSKAAVKEILERCRVPEARVEKFEERFDSAFGEDAALSPRNIVDTKQIEVKTPDVVIHIKPERSDLLETRVIDGCKYILIRANEDVEVDGVNISIAP